MKLRLMKGYNERSLRIEVPMSRNADDKFQTIVNTVVANVGNKKVEVFVVPMQPNVPDKKNFTASICVWDRKLVIFKKTKKPKLVYGIQLVSEGNDFFSFNNRQAVSYKGDEEIAETVNNALKNAGFTVRKMRKTNMFFKAN